MSSSDLKLIGTHRSVRYTCPVTQGKLEIPRHHADHYIGLAIQVDFRPQHFWIAMKAVYPRTVAQHHDLLVMLIFISREHPAQQRFHSQAPKTPPP